MTFNNLAILHRIQKNYDEALKKYKEALLIRKELFEKMPSTYAPGYSMTLINLAIFYQKAIPKREQSVELTIEAIIILSSIVEKVPYKEEYMKTAMAVLATWGLNAEEIDKLVEEKRSGEMGK